MGIPAANNPTDVMAQLAYSGQSGQIRYAGFWVRFAAIFIDGAILFIAYLAVSFILGFLIGFLLGFTGGELDAGSQNILTLISWIVSLAISAGYFSYNWAGGSTIGMRRFGIRVVDATTGQPIGISRGFMRWLGYVVSALACYIGLIWAAFDSRKQGWHDKIAGTVVIQE